MGGTPGMSQATSPRQRSGSWRPARSHTSAIAVGGVGSGLRGRQGLDGQGGLVLVCFRRVIEGNPGVDPFGNRPRRWETDREVAAFVDGPVSSRIGRHIRLPR